MPQQAADIGAIEDCKGILKPSASVSLGRVDLKTLAGLWTWAICTSSEVANIVFFS